MPTHTESHLLGESGRDGGLGGRVPRFPLFVQPQRPLDPAALAREIAGCGPDVRFVLDASFFDQRLDEQIWAALLSRPESVVVLPQVRSELTGWLEQQESHPGAQALLDGLFQQAVHSSLDGDALRHALRYYVWLLGLRKQLYRMAEIAHQAELGRPLTDAEVKQVKQRVAQHYGARGVLFARKGAKAPPPADSSLRTDEVIVVTAFLMAIAQATPTVVLTRDQDLFDQSYKLQWLLDTQYRGLLFADAYLSDPGGFSKRELPPEAPWTDAFLPDEGELVHRSEQLLDAILPREFQVVPIECRLISTGESRLVFGAETGMLRLLHAKAATGGLNTDRLAGRNSHIWVAPLPVPDDLRDVAVIAHDRRIPLSADDQLAVPILDINQTLATIERFRRPDLPRG